MKWVGLVGVAICAFAPCQGLAAGTYNLSSESNNLLLFNIYSTGYINGDDVFFWNGTDYDSTIFTSAFLLYDGSNDVWTDPAYFSHTPQMVDGALTATSSTITNTGIVFPGISSLAADLIVMASEPEPDEAMLEWNWTFMNSSASDVQILFTWFVDADIFLGSQTHIDDLIAVSDSFVGSDYVVRNPSGNIIAMGGGVANSSLNMSEALILDFSRAPAAWYGISDPPGLSANAGNYWSSSGNFTTTGPAGSGEYQVASSIAGSVQNDADANSMGDTGADVGAAVTFNLTIPASGSESLQLFAVLGEKGMVLAGAGPSNAANWNNYE